MPRSRISPHQPDREQRPAEGETFRHDDGLEDGAGGGGILAAGGDLGEVRSQPGSEARGERQPGGGEMAAGEGGEAIEVPGGDPAGDHVEQVAGQDRIRRPQPRPDQARADGVLLDRDRQRELVAARREEDREMVPGGLAQQPAQQREGQVNLHRHEQEIELVAGVSGEQVMPEGGYRTGNRVEPLAVGEEVDEAPRQVSGQHETVAPPPESRPAHSAPP